MIITKNVFDKVEQDKKDEEEHLGDKVKYYKQKVI